MDDLAGVAHVAGPVEREPDADSPSGLAWVQRCLRCDELLWRLSPLLAGDDPDAPAPRAPQLEVGTRYELIPATEAHPSLVRRVVGTAVGRALHDARAGEPLRVELGTGPTDCA